MPILDWLANYALSTGIGIARALGYQIAVTVNHHSIDVGMEKPGKEHAAWDSNLYTNGNLFIEGYANPIKPVPQIRKQLDEPHTVDLYESNVPQTMERGTKTEAVADGGHVDSKYDHADIISSPRFHLLMEQNTIESMVMPSEQWKMVIYILIAIASVAVIGLLLDLFMVFA